MIMMCEISTQRSGGDASPGQAVAEKISVDGHEAYFRGMYSCRDTHATGAR